MVFKKTFHSLIDYSFIGSIGVLKLLMSCYSSQTENSELGNQILSMVNEGTLFSIPISLTIGAKILYSNYTDRPAYRVFQEISTIVISYLFIIQCAFEVSSFVLSASYAFSTVPLLLPYLLKAPKNQAICLFIGSILPVALSPWPTLFIPICIAYSLFIFCSSPRKLFKRITPYFQNIGPYSLVAVSSAMVPWILSYSAQNSTSLQVSAYITTILVGVNAIQMIPRRWSYHYLQRRTDQAYQEFRKKLFLFLSLNLVVAIGITLSIEATAVVSVYVLASMLSLASSNKLMLDESFRELLLFNLFTLFLAFLASILQFPHLETYGVLALVVGIRALVLDRIIIART